MSANLKLEAIATSDPKKIADGGVASAMKHIFSQLEISELDIADGLKELLHEKKYDLGQGNWMKAELH